MGKVLDVEGGTVMNLDQNKVTVTAFQSGFEEGRLAWPKPIAVEERLPEHSTPCLVWVGGEDGIRGEGDSWAVAQLFGRRDGTREWEFQDNGLEFTLRMPDASEVTHWLELPPKPE